MWKDVHTGVQVSSPHRLCLYLDWCKPNFQAIDKVEEIRNCKWEIKGESKRQKDKKKKQYFKCEGRIQNANMLEPNIPKLLVIQC